ncbi:BnaCnng21560D [Brassica napus]|uniref:BnaCnng21560D protein n=1 Tax=Brassica napus TaxID=3708 RepID=A0A078IPZ7_BRANA|nr:BnaCnng21560D [Brassica napus]
MYTERLEKELQNYLPSSSICNGVKVIPPCGVDTAWHGGKLISNLCKDRAIPSVRDGQVAAACN